MKRSRFTSLIGSAFLGLSVAGCGSGGGGASNPPVRTISGAVTASGAGLRGAAVILSGAVNATVFTNSSGHYIFTGLVDGNYTVTPAKAGYTGAPKASLQTVNGTDISGVNFTESASSTIAYVVDDSGHLGTVDIEGGGVQVIGKTGDVVLADIAFDANGNLYGITGDKLYRVNKSSGAVALVGSLGFAGATSLVFSNCGNKLYIADGSLHVVNPATGAATAIGDSLQYPSSGDLAVIGDQLYLTTKMANNINTDNYLVKLDTWTGNGTVVGNGIGFPAVYGLISTDDVNLYGFTGTKVISINPTTGVGTLKNDFSNKGLTSINGAAYY